MDHLAPPALPGIDMYYCFVTALHSQRRRDRDHHSARECASVRRPLVPRQNCRVARHLSQGLFELGSDGVRAAERGVYGVHDDRPRCDQRDWATAAILEQLFAGEPSP